MSVIDDLKRQFPEGGFRPISWADGVPTVEVSREGVKRFLSFLKNGCSYRTLFDLTATDNRTRLGPASGGADGNWGNGDFSVIYYLISYERNSDIRLIVPLEISDLSLDSITDIWPSANWYEREVWDMFGIKFSGHPSCRRILMPPDWVGHPLRKDHPARATEMEPYMQSEEDYKRHEKALIFRPEEWGLPPKGSDDTDEYMYLNLGPNHPGTHGVLRIILKLNGEEVEEAIPDIGFHHRGAEKMGERQTFHSYIPYTDRIDYLGGVQNNLPYVLSVEKIAGIEVPRRAQQIRILMCELYRIANHCVWLGTYGHDVGAMTPVFWTFKDRERIFDIFATITGDRMHPNWFRIGGVAQDLPKDWEPMIKKFLDDFEREIPDYETLLSKSGIFKARAKGVGVYTKDEAIEWGVTGPNLRSCGVDWDLRKKRPYIGYDEYEFDVPTSTGGDSFDRCLVRIEEMRQSVRIVRQVMAAIEGGPVMSDHPLAVPGRKERSMKDIESLIHHFLGTSWGFGYPKGAVQSITEAPKGNYGYFVVSNGGTMPYRVRIRTPSFAHIQTLGILAKGHQVADVLTIVGSLDYVLADIDR